MKQLMILAMILIATHSQAAALFNVEITRVYTQSKSGSDAHLVQVNTTLPEQCNANRLHIVMEDSELYSAILANSLANNRVSIIYVTDATPVNVAGHLANHTCHLISVF
ncbi:hypothetical protein EYS14_05670 [Alteromonadaceae bacterium M269]|nr:hypothetical protein EYS14_05670 [Alteromonadaceae bacterium M269]